MALSEWTNRWPKTSDVLVFLFEVIRPKMVWYIACLFAWWWLRSQPINHQPSSFVTDSPDRWTRRQLSHFWLRLIFLTAIVLFLVMFLHLSDYLQTILLHSFAFVSISLVLQRRDVYFHSVTSLVKCHLPSLCVPSGRISLRLIGTMTKPTGSNGSCERRFVNFVSSIVVWSSVFCAQTWVNVASLVVVCSTLCPPIIYLAITRNRSHRQTTSNARYP